MSSKLDLKGKKFDTYEVLIFCEFKQLWKIQCQNCMFIKFANSASLLDRSATMNCKGCEGADVDSGKWQIAKPLRDEVVILHKQGVKIDKIIKKTGLSRSSVYKVIKYYEQ